MACYYPLNYEQLNAAAGSYTPSSVKAFNNLTFSYWERSLFQRAASVFKFDVPDEWDGKTKDFFIYCLYRFGFVAIFDHDKFGLTFQPASLYGYDFYYQPTEALISNPALSTRLKIGEECELLKLTPDYTGIWDIISYYAEKLSTLDNAINMSLINNKFAFILGAKTKSATQALKKMLDKINSGQPAVIYDSRIMDSEENRNSESPFQFLERRNLKESYLTTDQLKDFNTILNNFDCEVGIPTIPYEKKERMVQSEAESRIVDAVSRLTIWKETLEGSLKEVKALYPDIKLNIEMRYPEMLEGGDSDVVE